ncbi:2-oxo acid dehydrogenase subunit E2 [Dactylosporangium siamense]|uniref:Dihydrolipoamide acetyltransferase component of pyruvate dehydrogenase complex n=1 Tax=Dactylosporangium siamense TaxID=685454 RepID=A0A919PX40_9ACTN|nr:2-oxo acid dehydrogenase subunit E2 [Dactylosporangium siamense]GIG52036.1 dihydrolipoamide acetyltransferase component of pyruvate dehydrogenase complex [Dactylosporangium siamense]
MAEIAVPKLNTNDDSYVLLAWLAPDGQAVPAGAPVAEVETSKAVEELTAAAGGVLRHRAAAGADITPGQVIALVDDLAAGPVEAPAPPPAGGPTITAPALARMAELGISAERVAALGRPIVRRADIDALTGAAPAPTASTASTVDTVDTASIVDTVDTVETVDTADTVDALGGPSAGLSRNQRAVARTVARSAATIPAAYTAMTVDVGAALERAPRLTREARRPVGLAELFVAAIGSAHATHPMCFARLDDDGVTLHPAGAAHVGVTVDLGEGLYVPVVRDADTATIGAIARTLTRHRVAAAGGTFRQADLDGANITLTLHLDAHVSLAVPIVFPGQTCAVAVTAPRPELYLDGDGRPATRTVTQVGLAYDHRVINGREAARFLTALAQTVKEP